MKIEFLIPWQYFKPGQIVDWPEGQANAAIRFKRAKAVEKKEPKKDKAPKP